MCMCVGGAAFAPLRAVVVTWYFSSVVRCAMFMTPLAG